MLILTRQTKQAITIGENIRIKILRIEKQSVRIGIDAPDDVRIVRDELLPLIEKHPEFSSQRKESRRPIVSLSKTRVGQMKV